MYDVHMGMKRQRCQKSTVCINETHRLLFRSRERGIGIVLVNVCWFVLGNVYRFNGRSIKRLQYRSLERLLVRPRERFQVRSRLRGSIS